MYFMIHNTEDGLSIRRFQNQGFLLAEIEELTSEDIVPDSRAEFSNTMPDAYTETNLYTIIKGEVVMPEAVARVVEWQID